MRKTSFEQLEARFALTADPAFAKIRVNDTNTKPALNNPFALSHYQSAALPVIGPGYEHLGKIQFTNPSDTTTVDNKLGYDVYNKEVRVVTHTIKDGTHVGASPINNAFDLIERDFDVANQVYAHTGISVIQDSWTGARRGKYGVHARDLLLSISKVWRRENTRRSQSSASVEDHRPGQAQRRPGTCHPSFRNRYTPHNFTRRHCSSPRRTIRYRCDLPPTLFPVEL